MPPSTRQDADAQKRPKRIPARLDQPHRATRKTLDLSAVGADIAMPVQQKRASDVHRRSALRLTLIARDR